MPYDNDGDEIFTSVRSQPMTSGNYNEEHAAELQRETFAALTKRLELAEKVADMLVEECAGDGGFTADADSLEEALVEWEDARGARFIYTDGTEHVIATGRGGLSKWLVEQGYDADQHDWQLLPPEEKISIWCTADGSVAEVDEPGCHTVESTVAEWLEKEKKNGLLCSQES